MGLYFPKKWCVTVVKKANILIATLSFCNNYAVVLSGYRTYLYIHKQNIYVYITILGIKR